MSYIWYTVSSSNPVFVQGTYTPKVHAHVGRTVATEFRWPNDFAQLPNPPEPAERRR